MFRLGEKGCVKILYSESESSEDRADREIYRTFNPEAQCFKPIDSIASQLGSMSLSSGSSSSSSPYGNSPSPTYKSSSSPINGFLPKVLNIRQNKIQMIQIDFLNVQNYFELLWIIPQNSYEFFIW